MVRLEDFRQSAELPPGLTVTAIRRAVEYIERELGDLVEIYVEQANVFSALVKVSETAVNPSMSVLHVTPDPGIFSILGTNPQFRLYMEDSNFRFPLSVEQGQACSTLLGVRFQYQCLI